MPYKAQVQVHVLYQDPDRGGKRFSSARPDMAFDVMVNCPGEIIAKAHKHFDETYKGDIVIKNAHLQARDRALLYVTGKRK